MRPGEYDRHEDGYVLASIALCEQQRALREQRPVKDQGKFVRQGRATVPGEVEREQLK